MQLRGWLNGLRSWRVWGDGTQGSRRIRRRHAVAEKLEVRALLSGAPVLVSDINPAPDSPTLAGLSNLVEAGGVLYFSASTSTTGLELWKSDGTDVGTTLVKDINVGTAGSNLSSLTNVNGTLFFSALDNVGGQELWKSDGTEAGTVRVKDINTSGSSSPSNFARGQRHAVFQCIELIRIGTLEV